MNLFASRTFSPEAGDGAAAPVAEQPKTMTFDEVAASLVVEAPKTPATQNSPTREQGTGGEGTAVASSDAATGAGDEKPTGDAKAGSESDDDGDADGDEFDPFASENPTHDSEQELDGPDAELHEVVVDGQTVEVSLAELKRRYSGEAAIERRLQAATTKLTEANTLRETVTAEATAERSRLSAERNRLATALQALRATVAAPMVKRPDPALARTNPNEFNAQLAAFNADQLRVQAMNTKVDEALQVNTGLNEQELAGVFQAEATKFLEKVPAMRDPARAPQVMQMIETAATALGFTPQEVRGARDHRLYLLAIKAGMYDRIVASKQKGKVPAKGQISLSPGGGDAAGAANAGGRRSAADYARKVKQAQTTGSVDDVAATLIQPVRRQARR